MNKKFLIALAAMSIFNLSNSDINLGENFKIISVAKANEVDDIYQKKINEGIVLGNVLKHEQAAEKYTEAINLKPDYFLAYDYRGESYYRLKRYEESIADFTKCIKLNQNYTNAYIDRGHSYDEIGEYEKAVSDYKKVQELSPNYVNGYYYCGNFNIFL